MQVFRSCLSLGAILLLGAPAFATDVPPSTPAPIRFECNSEAYRAFLSEEPLADKNLLTNRKSERSREEAPIRKINIYRGVELTVEKNGSLWLTFGEDSQDYAVHIYAQQLDFGTGVTDTSFILQLVK